MLFLSMYASLHFMLIGRHAVLLYEQSSNKLTNMGSNNIQNTSWMQPGQTENPIPQNLTPNISPTDERVRTMMGLINQKDSNLRGLIFFCALFLRKQDDDVIYGQ